MSSPAILHDARPCPNCNASLSDLYCGRCGQENPPEHEYSLWSFLRETWQAFRGRTSAAKTLYVLLTRPGELTEAYVAGQRCQRRPKTA
ncbi:MAG: DUF3667 domain-containing protein [Pseudomonadota bacterium]|nr:DUF3667 domain-containing protein [Pseudomonadota bacterium]